MKVTISDLHYNLDDAFNQLLSHTEEQDGFFLLHILPDESHETTQDNKHKLLLFWNLRQLTMETKHS
jgi:hypothetical protein